MANEYNWDASYTYPFGYPVYGAQRSAAPTMPGGMGTGMGMMYGGGMGMPQGGGMTPPIPSGTTIPTSPGPIVGATSPAGPVRPEESYIENILRMNLGKTANIYMTFENNSEWNAKVFKGRLEAAGRDHIIISDPNGVRYILLMVNLDYITFDQPLNYASPPGVPLPR